MAVDVVLETENGVMLDMVAYPIGTAVKRLYPDFKDADFPLLGYIDLYGDTVFNTLQMEPFLEEWRRLTERACTVAENEFVRQVKELALRCQNETHLYLKFLGD